MPKETGPGTVGRDKLIAARAGRSVPAPTMGAAIGGTPAPRLFAASPTGVAGDTAAELATGTDRMLLGLDNVGTSFGGNSAVTDVSLTLSQGKVLAVMGENGSDKTTLLNMITGLVRPTRGAVQEGGTNRQVAHPPGQHASAQR